MAHVAQSAFTPASIISGVISISFAGAPASTESGLGECTFGIWLSQRYTCRDWKLIEGQALLKNISINNDHFICYRTNYKPAFDLAKTATYDVSLHSCSQSSTPMLLTYDVLSAKVQVCFAPYLDMEMTCTQENTPPSK
jgi:hypothetical protein